MRTKVRTGGERAEKQAYLCLPLGSGGHSVFGQRFGLRRGAIVVRGGWGILDVADLAGEEERGSAMHFQLLAVDSAFEVGGGGDFHMLAASYFSLKPPSNQDLPGLKGTFYLGGLGDYQPVPHDRPPAKCAFNPEVARNIQDSLHLDAFADY